MADALATTAPAPGAAPSAVPAVVSRSPIQAAWRTDTGKVREHNEDAVAVLPDLGLVVVADGIGGSRSGEVASSLATEIVAERFRRHPAPLTDAEKTRLFMVAAIEEANLAIWRQGRRDSEHAGMGTTVVAGLLGPGWLAFANVGDSRLYRWREGHLDQLTRDHSLIQDVIEQGLFETRDAARRYGIGENILTRALGSAPGVSPRSEVVGVMAGDLYLFCTDGLSGMVRDPQLTETLEVIGGETLEHVAEALVALANAEGGTDNITLALVRI